MKRFLLAAVGAALLALSACASPAALPSPTASPAPTAAAAPSATPSPTPTLESTPIPLVEPQVTTHTFSQDFAAEDGTIVLSVAYALPSIENRDASPALEAIHNRYDQMGEDLLDNAATTAQDAIADYEISSQAGLAFHPTTEEMSFEVTFLSRRVLSIARQFYASTEGAAHPTVLRLSDSFDLQDGRKLAFADFFTDSDTAAQRALKAVQNSDTIAQLGVSAAEVEVAFQPEQFYLTQEGFVFWFQPDTLGPSNSPIEVSVPYSALEEELVAWFR